MENIVGVLVTIAFVLVIFFILIAIFKWLWNITMPDVFGIKEITFWQAFRILILASILFGGHQVVQEGADTGQDLVEETTGNDTQG